jgi:hypothetical protein
MEITKYDSIYREPYEASLKELADLMDRLEAIDIERDGLITRMSEVREGLAALAPLVKENPAETHPELFPNESESAADLGLTDAIRRVLANANPKKLTPVGVRTGLAAIGFKTQSKNILPSIHTVLKRLEKNGEISSKTEEDGRTWYKWSGPRRLMPDWWKHLTANGTKPLVYAQLTPKQRREARELSLVEVPRNEDL